MNTTTTVGKTLKTVIYVAVSAAIVAIATYITGHKELFNPYSVALANIVLVAGKNFMDPRVRNL